MLNSRIALLLILFCSSLSLYSQSVSSQITNITLFRTGAQIERTANLQLEAGYHVIELTGLSKFVHSGSIQTKLEDPSILLLQSSFEQYYLEAPVPSERIQKLKDSIQLLDDEIALLQEDIDLYNAEAQLLDANKKLPNSLTVNSTEELQKLASFYRTRTKEIKVELRSLNRQKSTLSSKRSRYKQQVRSLKASPNKSSGTIVLELEVPQTINTQLRFSYFVNRAGWKPNYDIFSKGINQSIQLNYQAAIFQNTGVDWKNVPITLSNGRPNFKNQVPSISPIYAQLNLPYKLDTVTTFDPETYEETIQVVRNEVDFEVIEAQTNVLFPLAQQYDIPSGWKDFQVKINEYSIPAKYEYIAIPQKDLSAYLIAQITDYSQYQIISGNARVFYENTFVGKTYINSSSTNDTLELALGKDQNIILERDTREFSSRKWLGNKETQSIETSLKIRNNRLSDIELKIIDQIPISKDASIKVELTEKDGAVFNPRNGYLRWKFPLKANRSKELNFSYTIQAPKGETVYKVY